MLKLFFLGDLGINVYLVVYSYTRSLYFSGCDIFLHVWQSDVFRFSNNKILRAQVAIIKNIIMLKYSTILPLSYTLRKVKGENVHIHTWISPISAINDM